MWIDPGMILAVWEEERVAEAKRAAIREAYWALLPKKEADIARAKYAFDAEEARIAHARKMRIAKESRSPNFWGTR